MNSASTTSVLKRCAWLLALALPLAAGWTVRTVGIFHGSPEFVWHPDVPKQLWVARKHYAGHLEMRTMYKEDMELTLYPYGLSILASHALRGVEAVTGRDYSKQSHWQWAVAIRKLVRGLFLATALLLLAALARPLGPVATCIAGLLLLLEPLTAQLGHYAMNDVPMTALMLLAWLAASRIPTEPSRAPWASAACGLCLGIGFGVKYQLALAAVFPVVAWIRAWPEKRLAGLAFSILAVGACGLAGSLFATPLLRQDPVYFFQALPEFMRWQASITGVEFPLLEKIGRNIVHLGALVLGDARFGIVAGGAAALAFRRVLAPPLALLVRSGWLFIALLAAALVFSRDYIRANDVVPVFALLAVMTGIAIAGLRSRAVLVAVATAAACWFGGVSLLDARALARPDTRQVARDWMNAHIPEGSIVRREQYTLPGGPTSTLDRLHLTFIDPESQRILREGHYDFLVTSSLAHARVFDPYLPHHAREGQDVYAWIDEHHDVVASFSDRALLHAHPILKIYRKKSGL
jgi:hypothetical protein